MYQYNMFLKEICGVVLFCVLFDGSAFKLYDAELLLRAAQKVNLSDAELEEVLNVDPGGEYTTMKFQYEKDQFVGQYDNPDERCYNDHVRCLTTIMAASRPVCGTDDYGNRSDFASMCDLYLDNCKRTEAYWTIVDNGNCSRAEKIYYYDFNDTNTVRPNRGPGT